MLQVDDLNVIIKHFAARIYTRIQQLQKQNPSSKIKVITLGTQNNPQQQQQWSAQKVDQILLRYQNYHPANQIQVQYTRKLIHRVLQIFGFYKWKCRNQSILNHAQRQLSSKLNLLLNETPIHVGKIMSYIVEISKRGFINRINQNNVNHQTPKSTTVIATSTSTSVSNKSKRRLYSKSQSRQIKQNHITNHLIPNNNTHNIISEFNKRRTASVMCYSLSNVTHPTVEMIDKLYYGMNIDKVYLSKCIESQNYLTRDQMKRNKSVFKKVQIMDGLKDREKNIYNSSRKIKTQAADIFDHKNILKEIKMNTRINGFVNKNNQWMDSEKVPVINLGIFGKKWSKVKTTACKKRNQQKRRSNAQNNFI